MAYIRLPDLNFELDMRTLESLRSTRPWEQPRSTTGVAAPTNIREPEPQPTPPPQPTAGMARQPVRTQIPGVGMSTRAPAVPAIPGVGMSTQRTTYTDYMGRRNESYIDRVMREREEARGRVAIPPTTQVPGGQVTTPTPVGPPTIVDTPAPVQQTPPTTPDPTGGGLKQVPRPPTQNEDGMLRPPVIRPDDGFLLNEQDPTRPHVGDRVENNPPMAGQDPANPDAGWDQEMVEYDANMFRVPIIEGSPARSGWLDYVQQYRMQRRLNRPVINRSRRRSLLALYDGVPANKVQSG